MRAKRGYRVDFISKRGSCEDPLQFFRINNGKGQLTLFIILALIVVAIIILFAFWIKPDFVSFSAKKPVMDSCIENAINPLIISLSKKAGVSNPQFTYPYLGENITYVCYSGEYYKTCVVQQPMLKETFENSLMVAMKDKIKTCYDNSITQLKSQGYDVVGGNINSQILIEPGKVIIQIKAPTSVSKGSSSAFTNFDVSVSSSIYEMIMLATSITQFEAVYGDSETSQFNFYYPDLRVTKMIRDDGTKVYVVSDKDKIQFKFASRSLVFPAGYLE